MRGTRHLNITLEQGYKADNDQRIRVEGKVVSIRDILVLVKEMARNELAINRDKIDRTGQFYFKMAVDDAIDGDDIDKICEKYLIPNKGQ